ncbi:MAG: DUF512 domain-containing protein [Alphaproteobacteria bacterium]|nr:DUF512 domain-containing protein [Alphaproteobacteria bacterium]
MAIRLKDSNFSSYLDIINGNDFSNPIEQKNTEGRLINSLLILVKMYDNNRKQVIPSYISINKAEVISVCSDIPTYQDSKSYSEILFSQDLPIISVISNYLETLKKYPAFKPTNKRYSFNDVMNTLLNVVSLYDINQKNIEPKTIKFIENQYVGNTLKEEKEIQTEGVSADFLQVLYGYLSNYVQFDLQSYQAKIIDRNFFRVNASSAQRAITPFVFNNCKQGCRFCYVDRNLSTIKYPYNWNRKLEDMSALLEDYDPQTGRAHPILRFAMMDWEPTEHPDFLKILKLIAQKTPDQQIPIITHGGNLTRELLQEVAKDEKLKDNVLFQVSLNSANVYWRSKIMPGAKIEEHKNAISSIKLMHDLGIKFDVSIVAAIKIIPIEDVIETVRYADKYNPHTYIRVALPTATKHHNPQVYQTVSELRVIDDTICSLRKEIKTPIITTVGLINRKGLKAKIEDVIPNSLADICGIKQGDIILKIDDMPIRSRTEANLILTDKWKEGEKSKFILDILDNDGKIKQIFVDASKQIQDPRYAGERAVGLFGILLHDDVDYGIFKEISKLQKKHHLSYPHIFTGEIIEPFFQEALNCLKPEEEVKNLKITSVKNEHFGGNVGIAGLLVFHDLLNHYLKLKKENTPIDSIFVSNAMISRGGFDLSGRHINEFSAQIGIPVFSIKSRTGSI